MGGVDIVEHLLPDRRIEGRCDGRALGRRYLCHFAKGGQGRRDAADTRFSGEVSQQGGEISAPAVIVERIDALAALQPKYGSRSIGQRDQRLAAAPIDAEDGGAGHAGDPPSTMVASIPMSTSRPRHSEGSRESVITRVTAVSGATR